MTSTWLRPARQLDAANTIYTATYTVADANVDLDSVTIDVTGAQDLAGNAQQDYTRSPSSRSTPSIRP